VEATITRRSLTPATDHASTPAESDGHAPAPGAGGWAYEWPSTSPETVQAIRHAVTAQCRADLTHVDPDAGDTAVETLALVLAELVTNVHKHAPGPARVIVIPEYDHWAVLVLDSNPSAPFIDTSEPGTKPSGLGLLLVADLAQQHWGWFRTRAGKGIWAHCAKPAA